MSRKRDNLAGDYVHANTIRNIHELPERELCPKCCVPVAYEHDISECGGRTVRECPRCSWNDFDEQQLAHVRSLSEYDGPQVFDTMSGGVIVS